MGIGVAARARVLRPGGCIGVVPPGSPLSPERFAAGIAEIERRGFSVRCPLDPSEFYGRYDHGFASASPQARADALMALVADDEVDTILAVRGAYGTLDILPLLDYERIGAARKIITGCSDVTALLLQCAARSKIPAIHGPTLGSSFADSSAQAEAKESVDALIAVLQDPDYRVEQTCAVLRPGSARGPVIAGNLTMLITLLGTPWDVDYSGAILVIEDVGEAPYRIHRAMVQLKLAGKLSSLGGLVFGRFARCSAAQGPTVEEVFQMVVRDMVEGTDYPVFAGLESGHYGKNVPLSIGCDAKLEDGVFMCIESPLELATDAHL